MKGRYDHVLSFALEHPWNLERPMLRVVAGILARRLAGQDADDAAIAAALVDRKNLPQPQSQRSQYGNEYVAPQTEVESVIAEVWQKLLRVDRVAINDNFFELGGHSLLATQVINKLRETYSIELPLRTIFESPTIAGLAEQVEVVVKQKKEDEEKLAQIIKAIKDLSPDQAAAEVKALKSKASQTS